MVKKVLDAEMVDLKLAAQTLLEDGTMQVVTGDRTIIVRPGRMKQLTACVEFFEELVDALDRNQMAHLIDAVVKMQTEAIASGRKATDIDLKAFATEQLVNDAHNRVKLITALTKAFLRILPRFVEVFTDVTAEEFGDMDIDVGFQVGGAVFTLNYGFFTQRLLPIVRDYTQSYLSSVVTQAAKGSVPAKPQRALERPPALQHRTRKRPTP